MIPVCLVRGLLCLFLRVLEQVKFTCCHLVRGLLVLLFTVVVAVFVVGAVCLLLAGTRCTVLDAGLKVVKFA